MDFNNGNDEIIKAYDKEGWFVEDAVDYVDGMDFEAIVSNDLEEEDDMNALDAAFMRGYINYDIRDTPMH